MVCVVVGQAVTREDPAALAQQLQKVEIKKVIGPTSAGAAILLGNDQKTFVIYVGVYEATALLREIKHEPASRPLTHDLLQYILLGFDVTIKKIVISDIIDNAFCATLTLEQKVSEKNGEWAGKRNEVRIDARPSDCLVLAVKNKIDIYVTEEVFEQVHDYSHLTVEESIWDQAFSEVGQDFLRGSEEFGSESEEEEDDDADDEEEDEDEEDDDER